MNKPPHPSPVSSTLSAPGTLLAGLRREAERLKRQEAVLLKVLPEAMHGHCRLAQVRREAVIVVTDSPAWGNQLRFLGPALCAALASMVGYYPARLQVKVVSPAPVVVPPQPRRLSGQAGRHLRSVANSETDPRLRAALLKLAGRSTGED